jgi:exopolyphosphatase/pppGpp-phosphohydrolase
MLAWHAILALLLRMALSASAQSTLSMCAIDMGSNSFRRIVGSFANGRYEQQRTDVVTVGVGDDVARTGRISDAKLADIERVLATFKRSCERDGVSRITAVGTAAFREAPNGARVVDIAARRGIAMEIASEQRESELAYLVGALGADRFAVVDNGSRSIDLVSREHGDMRYVVFNLGYRVAFDTFFSAATTAEEAVAAFPKRLAQDASQASFMAGKRKLVAVEFAGMADLLFPSRDRSRVFTRNQFREKLREITSLSAAEFKALKGQKDIDRALPRPVVAVLLIEEFGYPQLELTDRELGAGLIIEAGMKQ